MTWFSSWPMGERIGKKVLLADPHWDSATQAEARDLVQVWQTTAGACAGHLAIPTGGTGGRLKLAAHDESTLEAAAAAFQAHFGIDEVNTLEVLPAYHVSGLMSRVRARLSGGRSVAADWKQWQRGEFALPTAEEGWTVSLVPTQLQRLLALPSGVVPWRAFRLILLGGGPAWPSLLEQARSLSLPVCPCYGMTETAAMVTALTPTEFLRGESGVGRPLPHATVRVVPGGQCLEIEAASLFYGYLGATPREGPFRTSDLGQVDPRGFVTVLGRADDVINSGGLKVSASWVEALLRERVKAEDFAVVGVPSEQWGEVVVGLLPPGSLQPSAEQWSDLLAPHQRPKHWFVLEQWPRDERGKLNRAVLRSEARRLLSPP